MDIQFNLPKEQSSIIKVIGVGGGGGNAVNYMFERGIQGVNFVVCNTDQQALDMSPVPNSLQLGPEITQGLGAGSRPEIGEKASLESAEEIENFLGNNTKMVFITAGMGGGTGTGGAPVIAKIARDMGILTVAIVTTPFSFEGRRKLKQAEEGIRKLKENVDSILVISNDKITEVFGNLSKSEAFGRANDILATAAKSISEIITVHGDINVDFADVEYVMKDSGVAIMGSASAEGEDRARNAIMAAMNSPLLDDNDITGARSILINISSSSEHQVTIDEINTIHSIAEDAAGSDIDVIFGTCDDDTLDEEVSVTIIATGFEKKDKQEEQAKPEVVDLDHHSPKKEPSVNTEWTLQDETDDSAEHVEEEIQESEDLMNFKVTEKKEEKSEYSFYTSGSKKEWEESEKERQEDLENRKERLRRFNNIKTNAHSEEEMRNVPAYLRRNVDLEQPPTSDQSNLSRFTLGKDNNGTDLRKNNSFLDDNPD